MRNFRFLINFTLGILLFSVVATAQNAAPTKVRLQSYLSGLTFPLLATNAKDGTKRLFVVQQGGIIKVVQPGSSTPTDFLNITSKVVSGGEQGLLGLAFHPQFATNGYFFVNYTRVADGATVIARYKTTNTSNALGDPNSERILLTIPQPFVNHNGGMIEFRVDNGVNNLYIGMGDGGSGNDPGNRAQNINELLGKFLRITPDVSGNNTAPAYTVPADNPYVGADGADEIYAIGVRNPFRWSFDRGGTRQLWAGDVGQGAREEVDIITRGGNYGWRILEGTICNPAFNSGVCTPPANYVAPVFDYSSAGARCSITGGYVYRGTQNTLPNGNYVYGDFCTGEILMWDGAQQSALIGAGTNDLSSFGEDEDGELYVVGLGSGTVRKIVRAKSNADFDGDGKTDISVFRQSNGTWYILNSSNNSLRGLQFGADGDVPTPEDFDGDGVTDIGVFRSSNGTWYRINSSNNTFSGIQFGRENDVPVAGDYDGDGRADVSVYRPIDGTWHRINSSNNGFVAFQWGQIGDVPRPGDFDGDGKYDINVFRVSNGTWYRINSSNNARIGIQFGTNGDFPAPGDFDGDGRSDLAVFRPSNGTWYRLTSSNNALLATQFGANTDFPAVGDYDADGRDDIAVFRVTTGTWYYINSGNNTTGGIQFGTNGDFALPFYDVP